MFLVDTNVISVTSPVVAAHAALTEWMHEHSPNLFVSVITVAEIESGILKARRTNAVRKAERLTEWFRVLLHVYRDRILPIDLEVSRILGQNIDRARELGRVPEIGDLSIAATATIHDLTILTRNMRHFTWLTSNVHDPFDSLPNGAAREPHG